MILFSIFATLALGKINPLNWLTWYFDACAANGGKARVETAAFVPWNLSKTRLAELRLSSPSGPKAKTS
jgi:hypothetical protein